MNLRKRPISPVSFRFCRDGGWPSGSLPKASSNSFEVVARQDGALAELRHVGAQVIDPDSLGVAFVFFAARKNRTLVFTLRVEDPRRQAQDGVQVALVHEVGVGWTCRRCFKQDVVGEDNGGATPRLQPTIDVLKAELLVAGWEGEVARRQPAALLVPKGGLVSISVAGGSASPSGDSVSP